MIRRKYPMSHKAIQDTQLSVALVGREVLQFVTKVEYLGVAKDVIRKKSIWSTEIFF